MSVRMPCDDSTQTARFTMTRRFVQISGRSAVVLMLAVVGSMTAAAQNPVIAVGSAAGPAGSAVDLSVDFRAGGTGVSTLQFDLILPEGLSSPNPPVIATGSAASSAGKSASGSIPPTGGVRVLIFGLNDNAVASGAIAFIRLNIAGGTSPGTLAVAITGIVASDPAGNNVPTSGTAGSVVVTPPPDPAP